MTRSTRNFLAWETRLTVLVLVIIVGCGGPDFACVASIFYQGTKRKNAK